MAGKQKLRFILAALAALIAAVPAAGQTASDTDEPITAPETDASADTSVGDDADESGAEASSVPESTTPRMMETISVSATRNPIESFEYPGMVTVVGPETIQTLQPSTPDDVLKLVPNVEFTGGPRRTGEVPSIRGFSGPDVVVLLDGARQNFNAGHDGRFFVDPSLLREAEVLRGSSSSLYGSGGTGGVISFRTVDADDLLGPDETAGVTLSGGYHTVNEEWRRHRHRLRQAGRAD